MKPILFSTEMVKAILENRKFQTRRVVKPQPITISPDDKYRKPLAFWVNNKKWIKYRYQVGGTLWVRETWRICPNGIFCYKAIGDCDTCSTTGENTFNVKWKPSIHMPKEACRLFLKITDIRVQRLQEITVDDVMAEGLPADNEIRNSDPSTHESIRAWNIAYAQHLFRELWDSLNAKRGYGWEVNPWVIAITFEKIEKPAQ